MRSTSDRVSPLEPCPTVLPPSVSPLIPGESADSAHSTTAATPPRRPRGRAPADAPSLAVREGAPLGGPGLKPYPKVGQTPLFLVDGFRWQAREIDCEPTQVFNALRELSRRHADPSVGLSYSQVVSVLPPALEGPSWSRAVRTLGSRLPDNYKVFNRKGSSEARWPDVERVLRDEDASLPIIGVSSSYWREVSDAIKPADAMDHTLLVLGSESEKVTLFDSYAAIFAHSTHAKIRGPGVALSDGIVEVSPVKLIRYWEEAGIPRYLFWIQRVGRRTTQRKLFDQDSGA
jgi:hypothetical protein